MDSRTPLPPQETSSVMGSLGELFRRPHFFLPLLVVAGMLGIAIGIQPGGSGTPAASVEDGFAIEPSATDEAADELSQPPPAASRAPPAEATATTVATDGTATSEVAGARTTPEATAPAEEPDYSRQATQCGALQETAVPLAVEQTLAGVSIQAQRAAVYPAEYLRCILMATGGREATALAGSIFEAQRAGATHAVVIDLWITNGARDFGQVNLRTASLAAAGRQFAPLATIGGRAEVVVSSGQGRNVTLVATLANEIGPTTGPITLTIEAPLVGGQPTAGKYQLFLPTP